MPTRNYSSRSQQSSLTSAVTAGATTIVVQSGTALMGGQSIPGGTTFTLVIDPDTALEEIVDATAVSTNSFTITRPIDGSSAQAHSAGAIVRHMAIGRDYREANAHIEATTSVHGISGSVVGTTGTQTLTNKTLTSPTITNPTVSGFNTDASIIFEGATPDAFETTLTVVDPTQDNTITLPNTTGTVVLATAVQTLTNKTMGDALNAGGFKITNLATPTLASDAVRKDFADAQVAAAATSATSAATSATSAATSATASATSATASASSASAAATSASSALTSQTAAATSATSASASATAASTSATSAAASASAAATSATSAATSATAAAGYVVPTQTGNAGKALTTNGTTTTWSATINGTAIPASKTLVVTTDTLAVHAATTSAQLAGVISDETGSGALVFGTSPSISNLTITGTLTAGGGVGTNGQVLTSTGTGVQYTTISAGASAATPTTLGTVHGETSTTLTDPVSLGFNALLANTTGASNTAVGASALDSNTIGGSNTAVGKDALNFNVSGSSNTAVGFGALLVTTGNNNTGIGVNTGLINTSGANNTFIGNGADGLTAGTSNNITLGNASVVRFRIPGIDLDLNKNIEIMNIMGAY